VPIKIIIKRYASKVPQNQEFSHPLLKTPISRVDIIFQKYKKFAAKIVAESLQGF